MRDLALDEIVALKTLGIESTPSATRRFRNEVKLARRITHKSVARVFDLGEHGGDLFLTMECVEGGTLRDLLRAGRVPLPRVIGVAVDLCGGLAAAHAAGVVHRDLKPTNVLVEAATGRVVMVDFGIAHALGEEGMTSAPVGTPRYMAPEQAAGRKVDARTDLWALGVLLLELSTGRPPEPTRVDADLSEIPAPFSSILRSCIAAEPDRRPTSADELARALAAIDLGIEPVAPPIRGTHDEDATTIAARPPPRPTAASSRTVAVLPFRYRGPRDREYLGESLSEEIVDALSRARSLRVLGTGATAKYRTERDARAIARELGAIAVVDGTVQLVEHEAKPALRLTVRVLDADGVQIHTERFEGGFGDALSLGDAIASRIAEQLRLELTLFTSRGDAPAEAVDLYLSGRRRARWFAFSSSSTALEELQRAIQLAPSFGPAVAAYAVASTRAHFARPAEAWAAEAKEAVERALAVAPELADTHFAAGNYALQLGEYRRARDELERAIDLAPTFAEAHEYLAQIFLEIGAIDAGMKHARQADELDPARSLALVSVARHHALHGEWAAYRAIVEELERRGHSRLFAVLALRVRAAVWRGDLEELRRLQDDADAEATRLVRLQPAILARVVLGEVDAGNFERLLAATPVPASFRLRTLRAQLGAEIWAHFGDLGRAKQSAMDAANDALVDVEWLDHVPLLAPLRDAGDLAEARRRTNARAALFLGAT